MTLDEASKEIHDTTNEMNDRYGRSVFDEWAIVSLARQKARVLAYEGPRNDAFLRNFVDDLGVLRSELVKSKYTTGDFEFARHATGTCFEAFIVLGQGIYLVCNNTKSSMTEISKDPRWLNAQVPFVELAEKVRSSPVNGITGL